jgi:hypothetical protein
MHPRIVEVRKNILKKNDLAAAELRQQFAANIFVASTRRSLIPRMSRLSRKWISLVWLDSIARQLSATSITCDQASKCSRRQHEPERDLIDGRPCSKPERRRHFGVRR